MASGVWELVEKFSLFMQRGSLADAVLLFLVALAGPFLLVFVHELGHALAAKARGLDVGELVVGDTPDVIVRAGRFTMRLGRHLGKGDVGGHVRFGAAGVTPLDLLVVSLAGPAANALAAVALLATSVAASGMAVVTLALLATTSGIMAVGNLVPSGDGVELSSDGRLAQIAWAARRGWPEPPDPNAATSVAPPGYRADEPAGAGHVQAYAVSDTSS